MDGRCRGINSRDSVLYSLYNSQLGPVGPRLSSQSAVRDCLRGRFVENASCWSIYKTNSPFNRRITCIEWHPNYHNAVAFASHGGDILLWNCDEPSRGDFIQGMGYGYGAITTMKFHPENPSFIYTTAVDGRFCLQDFEGRHSDVYLDTMSLQFWWCSLDLSREYNAMFVGDNHGNAVLLDSDGQVIRKHHRLHKSKIKNAEFCPARSWMLATASVDRTVALWDIRMLKSDSNEVSRKSALAILNHEGPVNSACFDPLHGCQLLTTAQNSEIRMYDPHNWSEPTIIVQHPHRHFQHLTDHEATWHPLYENLCVVGRYPDPKSKDSNQTRCVDLVDLEKGECVGSIYSPFVTGLIPLNKFNPRGDSLASGMGYNALIWRLKESIDKSNSTREEARSQLKKRTRSSQSSGQSGGSKKRRKEDKDKQTTTRKKMKSLTCTSCKKKR